MKSTQRSAKKFAVFDIDGTLFRSSLYTELAYELIRRGVIDDQALVQDIQRRHTEWVERREIHAYDRYDMTVAGGVDALLPHIPIADYESAASAAVAANTGRVYSYTRNLARTLKEQGYLLIAISGSPKELVEQFVAQYEFDLWVGQHWIRDGDAFTGEIIKTHTDKDVIIKKLVAEHGLSFTDSYAIGDTAGDIGILSIVDNPIAFNPTKALLDAATKHKWKIVIERKDIAYSLQPNSQGFHELSQFEQI